MKDANQVIEQALAILRRKSIDGYEICIQQSSHFDVESKESQVDTFEVSAFQGMAIRVLNHQRVGFSYFTLYGPSRKTGQDFSEGLEKVVEDAISSAEMTSSDPCYDFAPPLKDSPPDLPIFDDTLKGISEATKIEMAKRLESAVRSVDPVRIRKIRKASYQEMLSKAILINSNGLQSFSASTIVSVSVTAVAEESGESEVGWDFDYSHFFKDLDVEKVGEIAGKKALERLGGKRISSGTYAILIRNSVASEFLSLLAHSFLAEQIQKGKSPLKGKRGEKFFSSLLSIVDDGLLPKGISSSPVDGEGMPSQRTSLVHQGEISGFLYDRYWANRENSSSPLSRIESTGNSRRAGIKTPPSLGVSNLFIEPGRIPFSSLLKDFHKGILIEDVMGLHTVDPISGDFSLGCSGDWIDKGEKAHPVKSIAVAGNLFDLFRKVIGAGEDLRFFGAFGSPSLVVDGLEVSGE